MSHLEIEPRILTEWQEITNLVARLCNVPASLVMRLNEEDMEVMSGSQHPDSPYTPNEKAPLGAGRYCETVIGTQQPLSVANALKEPEWMKSRDRKSKMIAYYGVPVNWPDGTPFGTFCILDSKGKQVSDQEQQLISRFGRIIELTLELLVKQEVLQRETITDYLTQLSNRRHFMAQLEPEVQRARRYNQSLCVTLLDIDHFKRINDEHGHDAGDRALKQFAADLAGCVRVTDFLARFGGEEFALLTPNSSIEETRQMVERFRTRITPVRLNGSEIPLRFSAGIAQLNHEDEEGEDLLKRADVALYRAKREGRDRICLEQ